MTVYDDGIYQVIWDKSYTFNVFLRGENIYCFYCYDEIDEKTAKDLSYEHIDCGLDFI